MMDKLFQEFLDRPEITKYTRNKYFYSLRPFIALHDGKRPSDIQQADIVRYIASKTEYAEPTRAKLRGCLLAFFNFCIKKGECEENPVKDTQTFRDWPRRIHLPDEVGVIAALETAVMMNESENQYAIRDGLIFSLAAVSGNRRDELRQLPMDDLLVALTQPEKLDNGENVYRVYTSGKTGEAICRFTQFHVPMFHNYFAVRPITPSPFVFVNMYKHHEFYGQQLSLVGISRVRKRVCKRANVDLITYQELRRRLATMIARSVNVDVAAQTLNHSPRSGDRVIREYYFDPDKTAVDTAVSQFAYQ